MDGVADFLADEFFTNKRTYSTLNSYRSAISSVHLPIRGTPVGQHPIIQRLLKGAAIRRPPAPKYATTWDVNLVISHLKALPEARLLSLKDLTLKLVMLAALVSADRGQSLALMNPRLVSFTSGKATFFITDRTKTSKPGKPVKRIVLTAFPQDPSLCVKSLCQYYLKRTAALRSLPSTNTSGGSSTRGDPRTRLFISYRKPHRPVTSTTIARWLKVTLAKVGIKGYGAHSTRSASTSAAVHSGLGTQDILKAADWSRETTFNKFYNRSGDDTIFGRTILASSEQQQQ